jgi:hypothetical protein
MNLIVDHLETWLAVSVVGILTVFSDKILGRIRFALNRADLRSEYYEKLALDLSTFIFYSDLYHLRHVRGETKRGELDSAGGEVNAAFVQLKTNEYVYRSWVRRYWKESGVTRFESVMCSATNVYEAAIEFNEKGKEAQKTEILGRNVAELKSVAGKWLSDLDA